MFLNDRFYRVISHAVGVIAIVDPDEVRLFLPLNENDEGPGNTVRQALAASNPLRLDNVHKLIDSVSLTERAMKKIH